MDVTDRWRRKSEIYRRYARSAEATGFVCDWSEAAAEDMFRYESSGGTPPAKDNGYAIGKGWLDVQIASWVEDLAHWPPLVHPDEIDKELRDQVIKAAIAVIRKNKSEGGSGPGTAPARRERPSV